ncbi:uncharacterized protein LOC105697637 [Orussus abietinus]|uniref:uncharacterized protein LOC105697637 n=1 Tax=Orussus abietinus TaxID=222816 RepID=UPI000626068B|nr:uncharacterized protein LOC105697637 [Orussus abietinus]
MALFKTSGQIPEDAVKLTYDEALKYQWEQITNWKPRKDVWAFRYGIHILSGTTAMTGMYINKYYRQKLKLRTQGYVSSFLPTMIIPAAIGNFLYLEFVSNDLILRTTECPVCVEIKACAIQSGIGVIYPICISSIANFMIASLCGSYRLPHITDVKPLFSTWITLSKSLGKRIPTLFMIQCIVASVITYSQAAALNHIQTTLLLDWEKVNQEQELEA